MKLHSPKTLLGTVRRCIVTVACAGAVASLYATGALAVEDAAGALSTSPAVSRNGDIAFSSNVSGNTNLWVISAGQVLRMLTSGAGIDDEPAWSPDGQAIAFSRLQNDVRNVWTYDGSQFRQLTAKALNNFHPVFSPDGSRIAFVSDRAGTYDIWLMNADGSSQVRVTALPGEENDPSFSPSGSEIVFSETVNGQASLFVVTLATGAVRQLTGLGYNDWHPSWSPQGIIFSSSRPPLSPSGNKTIWIVQGDGTGLRQFAAVMTLDPSWTPDGNVVFTDEANPGPVASAGISVLDVAAGVLRPVLPPAFNGDLNGDGSIDINDVAMIQDAIGTRPNSPYDPRDRNGDGKIDALDARLLALTCTYPRCATGPAP